MHMDALILGVGFCSFGTFLLIHLITFRWMRPEALLKSLFACVFAVAGLPLLLMWVFSVLGAVQMPLLLWVVAAVAAMILSMLLSFVYILCFFGPYETSIRMRLVREFAKAGPAGITHQELLARYNPRTIIDIRLRRLKGSGDVIEKDGMYQARNKRNFFFVFDMVAGALKKWIG